MGSLGTIITAGLLALAANPSAVLSVPVFGSAATNPLNLNGSPPGSDRVQASVHNEIAAAASQGHLWNYMQEAIQHGHYGPWHESTQLLQGTHGYRTQLPPAWLDMPATPPSLSAMNALSAFQPQPAPIGPIQPQLLPKHLFEPSWHTFAPAVRQAANNMPASSSQSPARLGQKRPLEPALPDLAQPAAAQPADVPESSSRSQKAMLGPPKFDSGRTLSSRMHQIQAQQDAAFGLVDGVVPDLRPHEATVVAQLYAQRDKTSLTLMERRWLERLYQNAVERGMIGRQNHGVPPPTSAVRQDDVMSSTAVAQQDHGMPPVFPAARQEIGRLPTSASRQMVDRPPTSAFRPLQQFHQARPIPLSALGEQHPVPRHVSESSSSPLDAHAVAADDMEAMQAYHKSRGTISVDRDFVPPLPSDFTLLQHTISNFKLPSEWDQLVPWDLGVTKFYGAIEYRGFGTMRLARDPDLASKLSLISLSNQRLLAERGMWKRMGVRLLFAQSHDVAFALADAQMLKAAFPTMLEEDKRKLEDGRAAIISIERSGAQYIYRLFSVLNPQVIK